MSVLLDGEESEMVFIDHPSTEMSVSNNNEIKFMNPILMNDGLQSLCSDLIKISFEYPSLPPVLGGELFVDLRAALLCGCLFGGCQELVPSGRGDNKLSVARKPHKGQVCDSGGQQSGFGKGSCNYDRR